jgi:hypothetical protein
MMIQTLALFCALTLIVTWGRQALWCLRFARLYFTQPASDDAHKRVLPNTTVVVALRGADPLLAEMLRGLLRQDYPQFSVRIIVDSSMDSAWPVVREALAEHTHVDARASVLATRLETCSLKTSALLQATLDLDESLDVVALIDADVVPPSYWLRELVRPFGEDATVGATTGVRWYHPDVRGSAAIIRSFWSAGAAAQMVAMDIPWGGTLAVRAQLVRDPALRAAWASAFVEDVSLGEYLRERGLRLRTLPRLTMVNVEATSLAACLRFLRRQLIAVRLHHPSWQRVLLTGVGMAVAPPVTVALAWYAPVWRMPLLVLLGVGVVGTVLPLLAVLQRIRVRSPRRLTAMKLTELPAWMATSYAYFWALLMAAFARRVEWRGISYAVGEGGVRRLDDAPYLGSAADAEQSIV